MFHKTLELIEESFSGEAAKEYVADLTRFHRIQATPGYRAAAEYVLRQLRSWGLEAQLLSFPANHQTAYWSFAMFQEWDVEEAALHLVAPEKERRKLADYHQSKLSVIQRSDSFDGEAELVVLEDGEDEADYEGLDVTGKVVLTRGDLERVRQLAVEERGAVGIIYDGMRPAPPVRLPGDLPDALQYTSFWWTGHEKRCFGFVVSPREGQRLRRLYRQQQKAARSQDDTKQAPAPLRVRAKVRASFYDGSAEVVTALIPGQSDEEVVVVSHLCHPQPSANDNASGAATAMEVARALGRLVAEGQLQQPRRSIRFLWVPEMTGTYAYLATHEDRISKMVAGVNLDMVGQNQELCGSVSLIDRPPQSTPSFVTDLIEAIREAQTAEMPTFGGVGGYATFRHAAVPFSGGSDHYILSDPTIGVPTPMIIEWPDRFYHTSADTPEKTDPRTLARNGLLAATYAWFIANAGPAEVAWLGREMAARAKARVLREVQAAVTRVMEREQGAGQGNDAGTELARALAALRKRLDYITERESLALASLQRLSPEVDPAGWQAEVAELARAELTRAEAAVRDHTRRLGLDQLPDLPPHEFDEAAQEAAGIVPRRLYRGPLSIGSHVHKLTPEERKELRDLTRRGGEVGWSIVPTLAVYWADGQRTLLEIAERVEQEAGQRDVNMLLKYFHLLSKMGLVELTRGNTP